MKSMTGLNNAAALWPAADVQHLTRVLQQLLSIYTKVLSACEQNKDGLVENDAAKMESALAQLERHFKTVNTLEEERQQVLGEMAGHTGADESELTVSYLVERLPQESAELIKEVSGALKRVFEEIARINRLNEELVGQSIGFFNKTLDLVSTALGEPNYGDAKQKNRATGRLFDGQA